MGDRAVIWFILGLIGLTAWRPHQKEAGVGQGLHVEALKKELQDTTQNSCILCGQKTGRKEITKDLLKSPPKLSMRGSYQPSKSCPRPFPCSLPHSPLHPGVTHTNIWQVGVDASRGRGGIEDHQSSSLKLPAEKSRKGEFLTRSSLVF